MSQKTTSFAMAEPILTKASLTLKPSMKSCSTTSYLIDVDVKARLRGPVEQCLPGIWTFDFLPAVIPDTTFPDTILKKTGCQVFSMLIL